LKTNGKILPNKENRPVDRPPKTKVDVPQLKEGD